MSVLEQALERIQCTQTALAVAMHLKPQVVNNWLKRGRVPADHCPAIERVTDGKITCEELRPDVDWAYLRQPRSAAPEPSREAA